MFSDESCSCSDDEKVKSLPVHIYSDSSTRGMGRGGSERLCCGPPSLPSRGQSVRMLKEEERRELSVKGEMEEIRRNDEESSGCCSASPVPSHYKSPKEVDGDYSYAYSDSVSPAFLIRVGAAMEYSGSEEEVEEAKENIYEEIREKAEDNQLHNQQNQTDSRKSSTSSHEVSTTSSTGTTKSRFQKALEAVTRRSSRSLEHNNNNNNNNNNNSNNNNCNNNNSNNNNNRERSFHLSISKGRKKNLIDRARIDWDCDSQTSGMKSRLNKSSNDMLEEVGSCHAKVLSQLKLDVEDMLMPPPSPARDETQDDSGFHSGGMSSSTSTEHEQMQGGKTKKKSIMKNLKGSKRSESQPGRMNRCESIDLKEKQKGSSDHHQFRSRSKLLSEQKVAHYGGHFPHMGPHAIYAVHPQVHPATPILVGHGQLPPPAAPSKKGNSATVGKSYLSKLVSLPFMVGSTRHQQPPNVYGNNSGSLQQSEEHGRAFYL